MLIVFLGLPRRRRRPFGKAEGGGEAELFRGALGAFVPAERGAALKAPTQRRQLLLWRVHIRSAASRWWNGSGGVRSACRTGR